MELHIRSRREEEDKAALTVAEGDRLKAQGGYRCLAAN